MLELGRYPWEGPLRPPGSQTRELVRRAAEQFGIEGLLYRDCAALSQGQRQLVQLARVAVQGAPVLLLDEPNSALDFPNTHQFFRTLTGLLAGAGPALVRPPAAAGGGAAGWGAAPRGDRAP